MTNNHKTVMKTVFGSHLYGTNTATSDTDYKEVFLPSAREIVLGRYPKTVNRSTGSNDSKNSAQDVDMESFSFEQYLKHLSEGQTVALDMFFAYTNETMLLETSPLWKSVIENREKILCKTSDAFIRYCRSQVNKYGFKGSRMQEVEDTIDFLRNLTPSNKLGVYAEKIERFVEGKEHAKVVKISTPSNQELPHLEVAGKKAPYTIRVDAAYEIFVNVYRQYGDRALAAKMNQGIDWKAVSHAVRVCLQGIELAETGEIRFPLSYANHLVAIKNGERKFDDVSMELLSLIEEMESKMATSDLRDEPDVDFIDDFVYDTYLNVIKGD